VMLGIAYHPEKNYIWWLCNCTAGHRAARFRPYARSASG